ncbi:MAG: hypothetical protein MUF54_17435, partial [Polyangiaceae bacterium]|nr:hypothetical protein [Polyangiaceae bacterium]
MPRQVGALYRSGNCVVDQPTDFAHGGGRDRVPLASPLSSPSIPHLQIVRGPHVPVASFASTDRA